MSRQLPTGPTRLRARQREQQALDMRIAGARTSAIAEAIGVSRQHVSKILTRALAVQVAETTERAEEWRAIQAARIEERIADLMPRAKAGNAAVDRALVRYFERQAKLLSLDLQREVEGQEPVVFRVEMRLPGERDEPPDIIEVSEFEEIPEAPEAGGGEEPVEGEGER